MVNDVVILFGGSSSERLVSVASAQNVSRLLPGAARWFISKTGAVHLVDAAELAAHERVFEVEFSPRQPAAWPSLAAALDAPEARGNGNAFLLALHGGEGENGTVQALLEARRLPFTGSGSVASASAFDKAKTKALASAKGARTADARVIAPASKGELERTLGELLATSPRWVLKPLADGSSHGLVHLRSAEQVPAAAEQLAGFGRTYLAEVFIEGRELTVGVVDEEGGTIALPVSEARVVPGGAFDYHGKYLDQRTEEITPADLTPAESRAAQALAILTHQAVGCEGYSRTDMILTGAGPVLLEINTLPGLTKKSFIPQQLAAAGKDIVTFFEWQLELGRRRARRS